MAVKNWCYGAKSPDIADRVSDAIYAAHQYRNTLCQLEREKRSRHEQLLQKLAPDYVKASLNVENAEAELVTIRQAIQNERAKQRTKAPKGIDHLTGRAAELKSSLKELRSARRRTKKASYEHPAVKLAMESNQLQHKRDLALAKKESGLYWGTEAVIKAACRDFGKKAPPKFKRFRGEGQLGVQIQGGLDTADAFKENTLCYFESSGGKKASCYFRIASDGRAPVFAKIPVIMHRPLPPGRIKWAYLERRKMANNVRWKLRLTIDVNEETDRCIPGEVAIHFGWLMEKNGLRVATWLGSDGAGGILRLSNEHIQDYLKLDKIRAELTLEFNKSIESLREWMKEEPSLPDWLEEARPHLHAWRSAHRLAGLVLQWRENPPECKSAPAMFEQLNAWRKRFKMRWQNERRLSARIKRRRKDTYRVFVKDLADRYGVAVIAPIEAKKLSENSMPEELQRDATQVHRQSKWAAASEMQECIREGFPLHCVEVSSVNITKQCVNCGNVNDVTKRNVQCAGCGKTYDVDENAVAVTLARGESAIDSGELFELKKRAELRAEAQKKRQLKMQEGNRAARKRDLEARQNAG